MLVAAMVAMVLVAAAPAVAQVAQEFEAEDVESGGAAPSVGIANKGDQLNLCTAILQAAQSGNVQNLQGVTQYASESDDIGLGGSAIEITPEAVNECTQVIEQAAAAGAKGEAKAGKAEAKVGSPAEAKAGGGAEAKAGKAEAKALPKTGGVAGVTSLLALGAVALLVAGGLVARRILR